MRRSMAEDLRAIVPRLNRRAISRVAQDVAAPGRRVVVVESVFNIPGIGRLTIDAVMARDYPVIQGMILLTSGIYVLINLIIDIAYTVFDPRIRY